MKKQYIYIITIVLGVMFLGFTLFSILNESEEVQKETGLTPKKLLINSVKEIKTGDDSRKKKLDDDVNISKVIEDTRLAAITEKNRLLEESIKQELGKRVDLLYKACENIETKQGLVSKLQELKYKDVFLADMHGNTLYGSNDAKDIYARSIVLEQIQKVGRYGGGVIVSNVAPVGTKRYIVLKKLEVKNLFIGVDKYSQSF